jgi:hypothetical protein
LVVHVPVSPDTRGKAPQITAKALLFLEYPPDYPPDGACRYSTRSSAAISRATSSALV